MLGAVNKPLAVITVTYSPGEHLRALVESLPAATSTGVQVVLADNGSVDGAPQEVAAQYSFVEFMPTGGNLGYGTAINVAVRHLAQARARGDINPEYFLFTNPDVVFDPGSIDELVDCARRWKEKGRVACVGPYIREEDGSAYPSARAVPTLGNGIGHALFADVWPGNPWSKEYRVNENMTVERPAGWLSGSCLLVDWAAFEEIGGFDERYFMYMEDVDLGDRFTRAGYLNILCPTAQITHVVGHSAGKTPATMIPVHHRSAYQFLADRYAAWWQLPLRVALKVGLGLRARVAVRLARGKQHTL